MYRKGEDFETIMNIKEKTITPSFAPLTLKAKQEQRKLMEESENTNSPLYKIVCMKVIFITFSEFMFSQKCLPAVCLQEVMEC